MRLDLVTNDAGELVRREHARDLGSGVVVAIYRLAKLAQLHDLQNQAFLRQLDQGHAIIQDYCLRSGMNVNILFAHKAIFVAGQLMKGSRAIYDMASELGEILDWCGGAELTVTRDASRDHLFMFAEGIRQGMRNERGRGMQLPTNTVRLRPVTEAARLRGLEIERLPDDQRTVRMYASAVVVMRRFFEDLQASRYVLPRRIKRIAQSLVDLSAGGNVSFLGVTEARNANHDEAGRAVNSAILAVAMARELEAERAQLSQIAMAAMMHDVGRPRAMSLGGASATHGDSDLPMPNMMTLSEDQEDRLPGGTAAVLTALGRLNEPTIGRTVVAFEALWQRRQRWIGPLYRGARAPTLHARLVWVARRYNDLVTPEPGLEPPTPYTAIGTLYEELTEPSDRTVLQLLVSALGIIPVGTVVQLSTGEMAEVIPRRGDGPLDQPMVRLLAPSGAPASRQVEIDLSRPRTGEPQRHIGRVMSIDFWGKGAAPKPDTTGYDSDAPAAEPSGVKDALAGNPALQPPPLPAFGARPAAAPPGASAAPGAPRPLAPARPVSAAAVQAPPAPRIGRAPVAPAVSAAPPVRPPLQQAPSQQMPSSSGWSEPPNDTGSVPSIGTSPSQVASAMGQFIQPGTPSPTGLPMAPLGGSPPAPPVQSRAHDVHRNTIVDEDARTMMVSSPLDDQRDASRDSPSSRARPLTPSFATLEPPTAKGILETTPLPHVLVYMLDHQLSGTVVLYPPGQAENAIVFLNGVPAKVKLGMPGYFLGEYLAEVGALRADQVGEAARGAQQAGSLMGEYLVRRNAVSRGVLQDALERQLIQRVAFLSNLPSRTEYSYFADRNLLGEWGSDDLVNIGALNAVLAAVRIWKDRARVAATLARLGNHKLVMHERVDLAALHLTPQENSVLDALITRQPTYAVLHSLQVSDPETVASLVYSLAVTRQFAFPGQAKAPMAPRVSMAPAGAPGAPGTPMSARRAVAPAGSITPNQAVPRVVKRNPASGTDKAAALSRPGTVTPQIPVSQPQPQRASRPEPQLRQDPQPIPLAVPVGPPPSVPPTSRRFSPGQRVIETIDRVDHVDHLEPARTVISNSNSLPPALGGTGRSSTVPPSASGSIRAPGANVPAADAEAAMGHFRTAETQLQRGDLNGALAAAERAVTADPTQSEYAALRAWTAALARGTPQVNASIAMLDEILGHEPRNERALLYRGKLYKRASQPDLALADLERLLALNPKHREANGEVRLLKMHVKKA